ncbi:MAG: AbrB/MazE/SpoVT family DNA-binding domain-containing protein [Selenomonadaceae bacterium]|nr:AbrB/MazE/SpoVT family DNA-binding domain-containing protein [Selenomonadaceae bacterium]
METAKIFSNSESQMVALPKNFRLKGEEVFVNKFADAIVLIPKERTLAETEELLEMFTKDFMNDKPIQ